MDVPRIFGHHLDLPPRQAIELGFQRAAIAADLATVNVKSPFSILSLFAGDSAAADKYAALEEAGVATVRSPAELGSAMKKALASGRRRKKKR